MRKCGIWTGSAGVAVLLAAGVATAQAPLVQPGAPGLPGKTLTPEQSIDLGRSMLNPTDVKFMQGMIGHHAQAVEMVALLKERTARQDIKLLGQRIEISQADEIKMMQTWLTRRGQLLPDPDDIHMMGRNGMQHDGSSMEGMGLMPGMLTSGQMAELAAARGPAFDRLFLTGMIQHHGGALTMVHDLMSQPGAGEDSDLFEFTTHVQADQSIEIARMQALLASMSQPRK